jgi:nucleotide-binding universal stress UspA family protein
MFRNILIATDGSESAGRAVTSALSLAKSEGAKVFVVLVDAPMHAEPIKKQAQDLLNRTAVEAKAAGVPCQTIQVDHDRPDQVICATAKEKNCDLIVMGSHGRGRITTALLGSVTNAVLRHAACPVLVWR